MGAGSGRSMNMQELLKSGAPAKDAGGYKSFADMIDGGGAGMSGDTFKGGGLMSVLGNALGIAPRGAARERDLELAANAAAGVALRPDIVQPVIRAEEMTYSGRGSAGMPMQYGGRGDYGMPQQPMQYGGRGPAGMPYPEFAQDELSRRNIDYLRSIGMIDY